MAENNAELINCSICGNIIEPNAFGWIYGNNAQPVNNGRCCDKCNWIYVIPARIKNSN